MLYLIAKFGFTMLGSAFIASFIPPEFSAVSGIILAFGFFGFLMFGKNFREKAALVLAAAIGFSIVSVKLYSDYYPTIALDNMSGTITGTVTEISGGNGNPVFTVKTDSVNIDGAPQKITLKLSGWEENFANEFDIISAEVTFKVFGEQSSGEFFSDRSRGIFISAYTDSPFKIIGKEDSSLRYFFHIIREKISSVIYRYFIDWHAPFMEKLLLDGGEGLDYSIKNAFRRSGMSHILAISGMHMVIIIGLFEKLIFYRKTEGNLRKTEILFLIAVTLAYMVIGGLGMSVLRSGFMLITHYLSKFFFSGSKSLDNLGIAIVAVLMIDPLAACDAGFLMSAISCCAISVFVPQSKKRILSILHTENKIIGFFAESFCVSIVAFLAVLPVSAILFGEISLVAPFSNILAGFFAKYSIIFAILTVIIGSVPLLGFFAGGTAFVAMLCSGFLLKIAEFFAGFSFAYIEAGDLWFYIWLLGSAVLIIVPALYSGSFRYLKHSFAMSAFVLVCGIILDFVFFSGVSEIKISPLEHGTSISCSKNEESVLITKGLGLNDSITEDSGYDIIISLCSNSFSVEEDIILSAKPEKAYIESSEILGKYENVFPVSEDKIELSDGDYIEIISKSAVCFKANGTTLLYIFKECDIMDISPEFRRADIIVLDGVSPEDFPVLRCDYLILRKMGGFYSGTNEIITLNKTANFFAYNGNLKKGSASG